MAKHSSRYFFSFIVFSLLLVFSLFAATHNASAIRGLSHENQNSAPAQGNPAEIQKCYDFLNRIMAEVGYEPSKKRDTDNGPVAADKPTSCNLNWWSTDADGNATVGLILELVEYAPSAEQSCVLASEELEPRFERAMPTFQGYEARTLYLSEEIGTVNNPITHEIKSLAFCSYEWGRNFKFRITTSSMSTQRFGNAIDPMPIGDFMLSFRDQYLPLRQIGGMILAEPTPTGVNAPVAQGSTDAADKDSSQLNGEDGSAGDESPNDLDFSHPTGNKVLVIALVALGVLVVGGGATLLIVKTSAASKKGKGLAGQPQPPPGLHPTPLPPSFSSPTHGQPAPGSVSAIPSSPPPVFTPPPAPPPVILSKESSPGQEGPASRANVSSVDLLSSTPALGGYDQTIRVDGRKEITSAPVVKDIDQTVRVQTRESIPPNPPAIDQTPPPIVPPPLGGDEKDQKGD